MATNVTQKDKTLNEIMAWCDQLSMEIKCTEDATTDRTYGKLRGLYLVYEHCQNMLGYSGSMPSEVPNQSEDAKKSSVLDLLPHDMGLRVELDTSETYYLKSGWAERCDGIYGLAWHYEDASGMYGSWRPAPIAIMCSHVKLAVPCEDPETKTTKQNEDTK